MNVVTTVTAAAATLYTTGSGRRRTGSGRCCARQGRNCSWRTFSISLPVFRTTHLCSNLRKQTTYTGFARKGCLRSIILQTSSTKRRYYAWRRVAFSQQQPPLALLSTPSIFLSNLLICASLRAARSHSSAYSANTPTISIVVREGGVPPGGTTCKLPRDAGGVTTSTGFTHWTVTSAIIKAYSLRAGNIFFRQRVWFATCAHAKFRLLRPFSPM